MHLKLYYTTKRLQGSDFSKSFEISFQDDVELRTLPIREGQKLLLVVSTKPLNETLGLFSSLSSVVLFDSQKMKFKKHFNFDKFDFCFVSQT
jgi:hypothetical protein